MIAFSMKLYTSNIAVDVTGKAHTFVTGGIIFLLASITMVLRRGGGSQIFPHIIALITVYMIYFILRPTPFCVQPRQAMRHINLTMYAYLNSSFSLQMASAASLYDSSRKSFSPGKNPCFRVIMQNFPNVFSGQVLQRVFMSSLFHRLHINPVGDIVNA